MPGKVGESYDDEWLEEKSHAGDEGRQYATAAVRARSSQGVDDMGASTDEEDDIKGNEENVVGERSDEVVTDNAMAEKGVE